MYIMLNDSWGTITSCELLVETFIQNENLSQDFRIY